MPLSRSRDQPPGAAENGFLLSTATTSRTMDSPKIFLPMQGRMYAVTLTEQRCLSGRHELSMTQLRARLAALADLLEERQDLRQKTATKVKAQIDAFCRKQ
jgi:hypothetical protein